MTTIETIQVYLDSRNDVAYDQQVDSMDWKLTPKDLHPALSFGVHLGLTVTFTALYGLLFISVYIQLWMIWFYRHKRFSYQTVFLFLCLLWAGLRTTLFSFYFKNCVLANNLPTFPYWLLYCFPVCLQFISLCLLVLFVSQIIFRSRSMFELTRYKWPIRVGICVVILVFMATNVTCAILAKRYTIDSPVTLAVVRVVINDSLFIVMAVALSVSIYQLSKLSSANVVLEARGTTKCKAVTLSVFIILLYTSRALYNMVAVSQPLTKHIISFGYDWVNASDQADYANLNKGLAYLSFGIVLFVWEFLPTFLVVMFFHVRPPRNSSDDMATITSPSGYNSRAYFFDNPRRYDSDDDLNNHSVQSRSGMFESSGPFSVQSSSGSVGASPPILNHMRDPASVEDRHPNQPTFYDGT